MPTEHDLSGQGTPPNLGEDSGEDLVDRARGGDRDALERLLRDNYDALYRCCRRVVGPGPSAQDATQEALLRIVTHLESFRGNSSFSTWAYRIAVNASLDEIRRQRRRPALLAASDAFEGTGGGAGTGDRSGGAGDRFAEMPDPRSADPAVVTSERLDIDAALRRIPEEFRVAVVLRDVSGLSYDEIATVLAIPPGTVRSRIARGRSALAEILAPSYRHATAGNHEVPAPSQIPQVSPMTQPERDGPVQDDPEVAPMTLDET